MNVSSQNCFLPVRSSKVTWHMCIECTPWVLMGQNKEEKWGLEDIRALEHLPGNNFSYKELEAATFIDSLVISYKTKCFLTVWSAIILLGIYSKELKNYIYTKPCTWMFIATLFIISQTWKQPRWPFVDNWINDKLALPDNVTLSSAEKNKLSSHGKTWKKLKCLWLKEGSSNYMTLWKRQKYDESKKKKKNVVARVRSVKG